MLSRFLTELRRRRVPQSLGLYLAGGWIAFEVADSTFVRLGLPDWTVTLFLALILAGLPIVLAVAWFFDVSRGGIQPTDALEPSQTRSVATDSPRVRSRVLAGSVALGLALMAVVWWGQREPEVAPVSGNGLVVFPFTVRGGEEATVLGEGMVGLLGRKLDGVGDLVAVDPNAILSRVPGTVDPAAAQGLARELGGAYYLLGSVLEFGGSLTIQASVYTSSGDSSALADASVEGRVEAFQDLVDELAAQLVVNGELAPSGSMPRTAVLTTSEYPALKFFVEGERALRERDFVQAVDLFDRAIEEDSAFALAHYRKAIAAGWDERHDLAGEATAQALKFRDRLSPRDRDRLAAFEARRSGRIADAKERYETILASHPSDAEAWYELGEVLLHSGSTLGVQLTDAREPFARVAELDPEHVLALDHLSNIAAWARDTTELEAVTGRLRQLLDPFLDQYEAQWAFMAGDSVSRQRAVDRAVQKDSTLSLMFAAWSADDPQGVRWLVETAGGLSNAWWDWGFASKLASVGEREAAVDWIDSREADPRTGLVRAALLATLPYPRPPYAHLESLRDRLESWDPGPVHEASLTDEDYRDLTVVLPQARSYALGLMDVLQERPAAALARADELEAMTGAQEIRQLASDLARHIRAEVEFAAGRPAGALALLEEMSIWHTVVWDSRFSMLFTFSGPIMLRANALFELGRYREALPWFGTVSLAPHAFGYGWYWQARTHDALGETDRAAELYRNFIRRWAEADPDVQVLVDDARQRLEALGAD